VGLLDKFFNEKTREKEEQEQKRKQGHKDSALARAALRGQAETVHTLLDAGADINARTIISGWTPLNGCCQRG
jgi:hypothetical protein